MTDVAIVGGGPAGLYVAGILARRGIGVRLLEEHDRIGDPVHCTGIVGAELMRLPGVPGDAVVGWPSTGRFHSPAGLCLEYRGRAGEVCIVDRGTFDRGLAALATRSGATVRTSTRVVTIAIDGNGVTVHARRSGRSESLRAQMCVLACGASYRFQRRLGWGVPSLHLASAQTEVPTAEGDAVDIFLRRELAPTGFGWLVPIGRAGGRCAKVGVMAPRTARPMLGRLLGELAATGRVSGAPGAVVVRALPLGPLRRTYGHRVLAVGDAAGLVKPTTGGGIYYSLLSAQWAAETVAEAFERGDFAEHALAAYEERWLGRLGLELKVGIWFRRIVERLTPGDLDALTALALTDGVMPVVNRTARFNWHRDLILEMLRHPRVLRIVLRRLLAGETPVRGGLG